MSVTYSRYKKESVDEENFLFRQEVEQLERKCSDRVIFISCSSGEEDDV